MAHYRSLRAWQLAHRLALDVYEVSGSFPREERYELISQLRRAVLSVPTNLAEGQGRFGLRAALRFTRIAAGSLFEVDYLLLFASDRGLLPADDYDRLERQTSIAIRTTIKLARTLHERVNCRT